MQDDWGPGVQCPKSGQLSPWRALLSPCFSEAPGLVWLHLPSALWSLLSSLTRHLGQAWAAGWRSPCFLYTPRAGGHIRPSRNHQGWSSVGLVPGLIQYMTTVIPVSHLGGDVKLCESPQTLLGEEEGRQDILPPLSSTHLIPCVMLRMGKT